MSGLLFIGLVIVVLVLLSKLSEARYQLGQVQRERDRYARLYDDSMYDFFLSTLPSGRSAQDRVER